MGIRKKIKEKGSKIEKDRGNNRCNDRLEKIGGELLVFM